jgi:hypothetical protein
VDLTVTGGFVGSLCNHFSAVSLSLFYVSDRRKDGFTKVRTRSRAMAVSSSVHASANTI